MNTISRLAITSAFLRCDSIRPQSITLSRQSKKPLGRGYSTPSNDEPSPQEPRARSEQDIASRDLEADERQPDKENGRDGGSNSAEKSSKPKEHIYGNAHRRAQRNRRQRHGPTNIQIPQSFLTQNVRLVEERKGQNDEMHLSGVNEQRLQTDDQHEDTNGVQSVSRDNNGAQTSRYTANDYIWAEILATVRGGLQLPPKASNDSFANLKSHVLLHCPKDGGSQFLNSLVERCASETDTDLVSIEAQDIAEVGGDWLSESGPPGPHSISSLGFDTYGVTQGREIHQEDEEPDLDEDEGDMDEDEDWEGPSPRSGHQNIGRANVAAVRLLPMTGVTLALKDLLKGGKLPQPAGFTGSSFPMPPFGPSPNNADHVSSGRSTNGTGKLEALIDGFIRTPGAKRSLNEKRSTASSDEQSSADVPVEPFTAEIRPTIIHIRDFKEMTATFHGGNLLRSLFRKIGHLRKEGHRVLVVGTTSSASLLPSLSRAGIRAAQSDQDDWPVRTIIVTPERGQRIDEVFKEDEVSRVRQINLRHLDYMIRQKALIPQVPQFVSSEPTWERDVSQDLISGIGDSVWNFDRVHRIAQAVIGSGQTTSSEPAGFGRALDTINASDEVKYQWVKEEQAHENSFNSAMSEANASYSMNSSLTADERLRRLRSQCNSYEKKLLSGIIDSKSISTTFGDVHAPIETTEALKATISLSLIRPDAFSYGVLATDKLNGLLLYGPPGTGKTLLAKAVAKESGATMLEVSGAEIYDMYVGEGEKNTKAVFSLAKKLAPCVIFLDEADALFGTRGRTPNRTTHRELMNQFLKEMDGVGNDKPAFVMVATNRPFDLDDAVLRRLPRRILVDLPAEKDREDILRLHLQAETVDEAVSIPDIAKRTPFYSGSDLKNVVVAAAVSCVKEENAEAAKHDDKAYKFPERRTLFQRHFDKALDEISASISDDMSSLTAIRKFDEKYGDRKGRRKKAAALGFGSSSDARKRVDSGRVRDY